MMEMPKNSKVIYLYRHGETTWNVEDRIKGQLDDKDTQFTELGMEQIRELSHKLIANDIQVIYCSDYKRTFETAKMANNQLGVSIICQKELHGLNMGHFQGRILNECVEEYELKKSFMDYDLPVGGGESINQLNARIVNFVLKVCRSTEYSRIAIITHSAAISNLKAYLTHEKYISLNECILLFQDNQLFVMNSVPNYTKYNKKEIRE